MRLPTLFVVLGGVLMTANTSPVELELYRGDLTDHAVPLNISPKCAVCIAQCVGFVVLCSVACGPGEIFTPAACAVCSQSWN